MSLNDELFAIRIALQDSYPDEKDIIRELKLFLRNNNTPVEEINQKIIDFYKEYNINFSEDFISSINMHQNIFSTSSISSLLLGENNPFDQTLENIIEEIDQPSAESNSEDSDDGEESSDDDMPELEDIDGFDMSANPIPLHFPLPSDISNNINHLNMFVNIFANAGSGPANSPNHSINFQNIQNPEQFFTTFNNLISSINIPTPPSMEDVKVTLDEKDAENIESFEAEKDMNIKCSICMMEIKKGNKVSKLKCEHVFHTDCVMQWLKEYNYKCPVCRKECGQAKYHL
jgi:hypothetical protein